MFNVWKAFEGLNQPVYNDSGFGVVDSTANVLDTIGNGFAGFAKGSEMDSIIDSQRPYVSGFDLEAWHGSFNY